MVGLLGWALGGFVFGIIADYAGRVRTLALSILIYSVFNKAAAVMTCFALVSIFAMYLGRETKTAPLPR